MKAKISITLEESLLRQVDGLIDNVYIRNRSQAIEHLVKKGVGRHRVAVVLAGGPEEKIKLSQGEYRITAKLRSSTVIERNLKKLRQHGFMEIYIIARPAVLTSIFDVVKDGAAYNVKITYIEEKQSRGTADTLRLVKGAMNNSFLVVYGHVLFDRVNLEELWQAHLSGNSVVTLMLTTTAEPAEKGTVRMEGSKVLEFAQKQKAAESHLAFSPIFVAEPDVLNYEGSSLEVDVFPKLAEQELLAGHISSEQEQHVHSRKDLQNLR